MDRLLQVAPFKIVHLLVDIFGVEAKVVVVESRRGDSLPCVKSPKD